MSPVVYRIRVEGHLEQDWSDWMNDLVIVHEASGQTTLQGPLIDQSALYGLLLKLGDLGLELVMVERLIHGG